MRPIPSGLRSPLAGGLAGKGAELLGQMLLVALVPRTLGPANYGTFALGLAAVGLASASISVGGPTLLARFVPAVAPLDRPSLARAFARRLGAWRALEVLAAGAVATTLVAIDPDRFPPLLCGLVVLALALDVGATLASQVALALGRTRIWSFRFALQNAVLVPAALGLYAIAGVPGAVGGIVVASAVALLWTAVSVAGPLRSDASDGEIPPGALRFGVLQGLAGVCNQIVHRGGVVAVAVLAGSRVETGFAALAIGVALAGTYAVWQVFAVELPGLVERAEDDAEAQAARRAAQALAVTLPLALIAAALAGWGVPLTFGERFETAHDAMAPALALLPLAPLTALITQITALRLRPELRLWSAAAGTVTFLVVAALLVPSLGAPGGVAAVLAATMASVVAGAALLRGGIRPRLAGAAICASGVVLAVGLVT